MGLRSGKMHVLLPHKALFSCDATMHVEFYALKSRMFKVFIYERVRKHFGHR